MGHIIFLLGSADLKILVTCLICGILRSVVCDHGWISWLEICFSISHMCGLRQALYSLQASVVS